MKNLLLFCFIAALCACAKAPVEPLPETFDTWQKMVEISKTNSEIPSRIQFSLRFGTEGNTRRVNALLWSNDNEAVRLDVSAGIGVTMAKVLDEPGNFIMVVPQENKAYIHNGKQRPLLRIGAPLPFDLSQLAHILAGQYTAAFGIEPENSENTAPSATYQLANPPGGSLKIDQDGLPAAWNTASWKLSLFYRNDEKMPSELRLTGLDGKIAVLLVKSREFSKDRFKDDQMSLEIPAGMRKLPLSEYK